MPQRLRVFVSSPADVPDERLRADLIIDKLAQDFSGYFAIESYRWEHEAMLASKHFQDAIEPPSAFDIVVLILWSRLGTPLPERTGEREYRGIDGRAPVTGTEWEYEEALRAARERGAPDLLAFRNVSPAPFDTRDAESRARSNAQLDALDRFWARHFADKGVFLAAYDEYRTLEEFARRLEESLRRLIERRIRDAAAALPGTAPVWLGDPFRGLESYEFEHAPIFFGRDAAVMKATEQLAANARSGSAFLLIAGASGSGKSSLAKAGVVPRLMKPQRISGVAFLRRIVFRPGAEGADPIRGLANALTRASGEDVGLPELIAPGQDAAQLAAHFRGAASESGYLFSAALGRLTEAGRESGRLLAFEDAKLILIVDQLEELFTAPEITSDDRRLFIQLLAGLARSGAVWVIATLRADFWHRAMEIPDLIGLAEGLGRLDLAAPSPAELAEMIRRPAQAAGLSFEVHEQSGIGLDAVLAEHAAAAPGVLPLLSFTLDELYRDAQANRRAVLTYASYEKLGGLEGAIASRADEIVGALPAAAQSALPRVLRALATIAGDAEQAVVARTAPLAGFEEGSPARVVVDAFTAARLLVASETGAVPSVRLVHEALISRWQRARDQLAADRRDLETRAIVERDFGRWSRAAGRSRRLLLLRNPDLANAVDLVNRWGEEIDQPVRGFVRRSAQRARLAQVLVASAAIVFAIVAGVAIYAEREAAQQRQRALDTLAAATRTANGLVNDLAQRFRNTVGIPATLVKDILDRARALQEQLIKSGQMTPDLKRSEAEALMATANTLLTLGDTKGALATAQQAQQIFLQLLADSPGSTDYQRELSVSYSIIGDVQVKQGDLTGALKSYRGSLAIRERLAKTNPDNLRWRRDLASSNDNVGDVQVAQGDLAGALKSYRDAFEIRNLLEIADPRDGQYSLSLSYGKIGNVQVAQGDLAGALKSFRDGLAIDDRLAKSDPGNASLQHRLAVSYSKIGDVLRPQGDLAGALTSYRDSLAIIERLAQSDPGNAGWQHDLSVAYDRIGDVLSAQGDLAGALKFYRDSFAIIGALAKSDPGNAFWQHNLVASYNSIGDVQKAHGELADALKSYRDGLTIIEHLAQSDPSNAGWQRDLVIFYSRIGGVLKAQGDLAGALKSYGDSLAIIQRLAQTDPSNGDWQRGLLVAYDKIGDIQMAQRDLAGALKSYRDGFAVIDRLAKSNPSNAGWQDDLAISYRHIGDVQVAQGDSAGALESYLASLAIRERLAKSEPDNPDWQSNLAYAYVKVGDVHLWKTDYDRAIADFDEAVKIDPKYAYAYYKRGLAYEAKKDYEHAIADLSDAIRLNPKNVDAFNNRCWVRTLANRDLQGALADCDEALRLRPGDANTLNSRGLIQLKLGAYDGAIADYSAAIAQNEKDANSLYGRGVAKLKKGDTDSGNADIAAAKAIKSDIAEVFAGYGVT